MALTRPEDLTLRPARITLDRFKEILKRKPSPAYPQATAIWNQLIAGGVDPSFALAHYWVESNHGTAGFSKDTHSWGNILYSRTQTPGRDTITKYVGTTPYVYCAYPTVLDSIPDYVMYLQWYASDNRTAHYGDSSRIYEACARWAGKDIGSDPHKKYVSIVISEINDDYEFVPGVFVEVGDKMIFAGEANAQSDLRYPVQNGTALYKGTNGDLLKYASFGDGKSTTVGICQFFGPVGQPYSDGSWAWGLIKVGTSAADPKGTLMYIKDPVKSKVTHL